MQNIFVYKRDTYVLYFCCRGVSLRVYFKLRSINIAYESIYISYSMR